MARASWLGFQRGWMMWREPNVIIAASDDGWWGSFTDQWDQGQVFTGQPPNGCFVPQRGLGDVWHRNGLDAKLGYALSDQETRYDGEATQVSEGWQVLDPWGDWHIMTEEESESEPDPPVSVELPAGMIYAWHPPLTVKLPSGKRRNLSFYRGDDPIEGGILVHWVGCTVTLHPDGAATLVGTTTEILKGDDARELSAYLDLLGVNRLPLINGGPGE